MAELRSSGCPINTAISIATSRGIVKDTHSNLLSKNGGHIDLTKDWAKDLLQRMNYVKRRGSSTAKVAVENFTQVKVQFLFDVQSLIEIEEIPSALIINWDQTAIKYIPLSTWTIADEGST